MDNLAKGKKKSAVSKMFQGGQDTLKPFKVRILCCIFVVQFMLTLSPRNTISLPSLLPFTSCVLLCALVVHVALKWSV